MPTKQITRQRAKSSTPKRDNLAPYREQARKIISLYFNPNTPAFVFDLLSSWLNELENETQIFWNKRAVMEVALPLMLKAAADDGVDIYSAGSTFNQGALIDAHGANEAAEQCRRVATEGENLRRELQRDGEAFARLINSRHLSQDIRAHIAEIYDELTDIAMNEPDAIKAKYTDAMLMRMKGESGIASSLAN